jgi:hypothetical protein
MISLIACHDDVSVNKSTEILQYGRIFVDSYPQGAQVLIDGKYTGNQTPIVFDSIVAGAHQIKIIKEYFTPYEFNINVRSDSIIDIQHNLKHTVNLSNNFPLTVGSWWRYSSLVYLGNNVYGLDTLECNIIDIVNYENKGPYTVWVERHKYQGQAVTDTLFVCSNSDSLIFDLRDKYPGYPIRLFLYPLEVGKKWYYYFFEYHVSSIDTVTINSKIFNSCTNVLSFDTWIHGTERDNYWIKNDVGFVRINIRGAGVYTPRSWDLISYYISPN